eukprot:2289672-Lingulodinium_polyedra.AAC.1
MSHWSGSTRVLRTARMICNRLIFLSLRRSRELPHFAGEDHPRGQTWVTVVLEIPECGSFPALE